jgi:hypothetical protein
MKTLSTILFATVAVSLPSFAHTQARVTRIVGPDGSAIPATNDVELIAFGSILPVTVRQESRLGIGDELRAKTGNVIILLACSDSAGVTLQGQFRAVIMPRPGGKACFLDLFAGAAHVLGDTSTGLGAGDVMMGARRTQYTVTVSRSGDSVRQDLQVFDGEVEVRSTTREDRVSTGRTLAIYNGDYDRDRITPQQIRTAARLYALVDASGLRPDARPIVAESLSHAYQQVLANPDSTAARFRLIAAQVRYGATSRGTLYQIERVKASAPRTRQLEATTVALSVAVYTQLGEEEKAAARFEALRNYDAQTLDTALRAYRIDPEVIRRVGRFDARVSLGIIKRAPDTLRLSAEASPPTIRPGGRTRIMVRVTTSSGAPVSGATVTISAGGGAFEGGGTALRGFTSAEGVLVTVWSCASCAAGYRISVDAAKEGFVGARANISVRVQ